MHCELCAVCSGIRAVCCLLCVVDCILCIVNCVLSVADCARCVVCCVLWIRVSPGDRVPHPLTSVPDMRRPHGWGRFSLKVSVFYESVGHTHIQNSQSYLLRTQRMHARLKIIYVQVQKCTAHSAQQTLTHSFQHTNSSFRPTVSSKTPYTRTKK